MLTSKLSIALIASAAFVFGATQGSAKDLTSATKWTIHWDIQGAEPQILIEQKTPVLYELCNYSDDVTATALVKVYRVDHGDPVFPEGNLYSQSCMIVEASKIEVRRPAGTSYRPKGHIGLVK